MLVEPLKSLGKKGITLNMARDSLKRKKAMKSKKARKGRLGLFLAMCLTIVCAIQ